MSECHVPEGCCVPLEISQSDFLCSMRGLMPPGQFWNKYQNGKTESFIDSLMVSLYSVITYMNTVALELDPCTAEFTLDTWASRYGIDVKCDILPYCPSDMTITQRNTVIALLVCLRERMQYIDVLNLDTLRELALAFGVKLRVFQPGLVLPEDKDRCIRECQTTECVECEPMTWVPDDCCIKVPHYVKQPIDEPFYTTVDEPACNLANGSHMYTSTDCCRMPPVLVFRLCPFDTPVPPLDCLNWMQFPIAPITDTYIPATVCSVVGSLMIGHPMFDVFACFLAKAFPPNYTVCLEFGCNDCDDNSGC